MPSSGHCQMIMDIALTGADFRAHWQGVDGGGCRGRTHVFVRACARVCVRTERGAEAWPGLRFSNEITALEKRKERKGVEGRKGKRGEERGGTSGSDSVFVSSPHW